MKAVAGRGLHGLREERLGSGGSSRGILVIFGGNNEDRSFDAERLAGNLNEVVIRQLVRSSRSEAPGWLFSCRWCRLRCCGRLHDRDDGNHSGLDEVGMANELVRPRDILPDFRMTG